MVTKADNELMTRIGPGTPAGELLRRYWHPVCPVSELGSDNPKKRVRILGEDLILYRDGSGRVGLLREQCSHRLASLYYGFIEEDGLRCPYHGWKYNSDGDCIDRPFEPNPKTVPSNVCQGGFLVEKLAGIYWAYLGPKPAPLLPRWDVLVSKNGPRIVEVSPIVDCNWLQIMENSVDTTHTYWLHAQMMVREGLPKLAAYYDRPIEAYNFEVVKEETWVGIRKVREYGGDEPEKELGHPVIFPLTLLVPSQGQQVMHFRVPIDDTHTRIIRVRYTPHGDTTNMDWDNPGVEYGEPYKGPDGEYVLRTFPAQDAMAWETEGPIVDRTREMLGVSDKGIAMFRRMLREQIEAVSQGREPVGLIRDPALNQSIEIAVSTGQARMAQKLGLN
jgi:5,5'-dehydrodivanillate O-demethylase